MTSIITEDEMIANARDAYWRKNVAIMSVLLVVWAVVGLGAGVLFADSLNAFSLGGYPLGFWFAQQGSIFVFIALIFIYVYAMHRLDLKYGLADAGEPDSYDVMDGQKTGGSE